jgi:2-polyprenyl-3-methyl-5-hydroxy-6-metoxy-1,4-benzoquinol methylase
MSDFREPFYEKYDSTFKEYISNESPEAIASNWRKLRKKVLPLLIGYSKDANILDLGCGPGYIMQSLRSEGFKNITGIDISSEQIVKAKQKGLNVKVGNVFDYLILESNKYDIIIAFDFIEHFDKDELIKLIALINQTLKNGGILVIHTPNGQGMFPQKIIYGDLTHLTIVTPNSLIQLLKLEGFDEIKIIESGPVAVNIIGFLRLIIWKTIKILYNIIRLAETGGRDKILTQDLFCVAKK